VAPPAAAPGASGRAVFRAEGLSDQGGSAAAYAYDAGSAATAATARRVAAVLGVDGVVRTERGGWAAGPSDDTGARLWLAGDGRASFAYKDPTIDPWACAARRSAPCPTPPPTSVTDTAASARLGEVMRALGVDPARWEVEVAPAGAHDSLRYVTARRLVGGTRTEDAWIATVGNAGLVELDGSLADVVGLGRYRAVSPVEAVQRLGDPRFGALGPVAGAADSTLRSAAPEAGDGVPAPPRAGDPLAWPVDEIVIVRARLGLSEQRTAGGAVLFVPAYELTDADGDAWAVLAVTEESLDFAIR
jgi:hypothetical protein